MLKKIIVTGASGFIGQHFIEEYANDFHIETISLRKTKVEDIDFSNVEAILHLAGIAHRMDQPEGQIYYDVNATLAKEFASRSKENGVPHFIYVSTVKVYNDKDEVAKWDETSDCFPDDDYGKSKIQGENEVRSLEDDSFIVSVVRPPMVYGGGVKGNMIRLIELVNKGYPLPFKGMKNKRSIVFVGNLNALFSTIIQQKASGVFIGGDSQPVSTTDIVNNIYKGLGKKPFWFKIPSFLKKILEKVKPNLAKRLFGSFIIDNTNTNRKLNFTPPFTTEEGISKMTNWYTTSTKIK